MISSSFFHQFLTILRNSEFISSIRFPFTAQGPLTTSPSLPFAVGHCQTYQSFDNTPYGVCAFSTDPSWVYSSLILPVSVCGNDLIFGVDEITGTIYTECPTHPTLVLAIDKNPSPSSFNFTIRNFTLSACGSGFSSFYGYNGNLAVGCNDNSIYYMNIPSVSLPSQSNVTQSLMVSSSVCGMPPVFSGYQNTIFSQCEMGQLIRFPMTPLGIAPVTTIFTVRDDGYFSDSSLVSVTGKGISFFSEYNLYFSPTPMASAANIYFYSLFNNSLISESNSELNGCEFDSAVVDPINGHVKYICDNTNSLFDVTPQTPPLLPIRTVLINGTLSATICPPSYITFSPFASFPQYLLTCDPVEIENTYNPSNFAAFNQADLTAQLRQITSVAMQASVLVLDKTRGILYVGSSQGGGVYSLSYNSGSGNGNAIYSSVASQQECAYPFDVIVDEQTGNIDIICVWFDGVTIHQQQMIQITYATGVKSYFPLSIGEFAPAEDDSALLFQGYYAQELRALIVSLGPTIWLYHTDTNVNKYYNLSSDQSVVAISTLYDPLSESIIMITTTNPMSLSLSTGEVSTFLNSSECINCPGLFFHMAYDSKSDTIYMPCHMASFGGSQTAYTVGVKDDGMSISHYTDEQCLYPADVQLDSNGNVYSACTDLEEASGTAQAQMYNVTENKLYDVLRLDQYGMCEAALILAVTTSYNGNNVIFLNCYNSILVNTVDGNFPQLISGQSNPNPKPNGSNRNTNGGWTRAVIITFAVGMITMLGMKISA